MSSVDQVISTASLLTCILSGDTLDMDHSRVGHRLVPAPPWGGPGDHRRGVTTGDAGDLCIVSLPHLQSGAHCLDGGWDDDLDTDVVGILCSEGGYLPSHDIASPLDHQTPSQCQQYRNIFLKYNKNF